MAVSTHSGAENSVIGVPAYLLGMAHLICEMSEDAVNDSSSSARLFSRLFQDSVGSRTDKRVNKAFPDKSRCVRFFYVD